MRYTLIAALLTVGALLTASTTHADDQQDYQLYSTLINAGWEIWNPPGIKQQALDVCTSLAVNQPWRQTITRMMNMGYTFDEAATLFAVANSIYCPQLSPQQQDIPA